MLGTQRGTLSDVIFQKDFVSIPERASADLGLWAAGKIVSHAMYVAS